MQRDAVPSSVYAVRRYDSSFVASEHWECELVKSKEHLCSKNNQCLQRRNDLGCVRQHSTFAK